MTFDVLVDDRNTALHRFMTFGAVGNLDEESKIFYSFGLHGDGTMAYSSDDVEPETTHRIEIFGRPVVIGGTFDFFERGQPFLYRIIAVTSLLENLQ